MVHLKNSSRTQATAAHNSLVPIGANAASTIAGSNPTLTGGLPGTAPAVTPQAAAELTPSMTVNQPADGKHNHSRSVMNLQNVDLQEIFFMNKSIKKNVNAAEEDQ